VVAPAAFKGALSAVDAAGALATGLGLALPAVELRLVPVADGGEGTLDALVSAAGGVRRAVRVTGPRGRRVNAEVGELPDGTAVVELASAAGYERLRADERDPEATTTAGVGELIRAALDRGARRIVVGVGGSATTDGGLGLARALGARVLDGEGRELAGTGADLGRVEAVDRSGLDSRVAEAEIVVACDVASPFHGPEGAARVFGPQKGADPEAVERLDASLAHLAGVLVRETGVDVGMLPGAGAAGGAAGGMAALLGATLRPGAPLVLEAVGFAGRLAGAGLGVTGEGRLDEQSLSGKAPAAVAAACREAGVPCVAVCGELALLPGIVRRMGLAAALPINRRLRPPAEALAECGSDLAAMGAAIGGLLAALRPGPPGRPAAPSRPATPRPPRARRPRSGPP
jgi:glycerate kinase